MAVGTSCSQSLLHVLIEHVCSPVAFFPDLILLRVKSKLFSMGHFIVTKHTSAPIDILPLVSQLVCEYSKLLSGLCSALQGLCRLPIELAFQALAMHCGSKSIGTPVAGSNPHV